VLVDCGAHHPDDEHDQTNSSANRFSTHGAISQNWSV
jgi:hypothetical protein